MSQIDIYKIRRHCSNCDAQEEIEVTEREAAFDLVDINQRLGSNCKKCSSISFFISRPLPIPNFELLKEWAFNEDLYFSSQDEDLLLADGEALDAILEILDMLQLPDYKTGILMSALCVIVYNNTLGDDPQFAELRVRVIEELNKRLDKLLIADAFIMDYIKAIVYPQLTESN